MSWVIAPKACADLLNSAVKMSMMLITRAGSASIASRISRSSGSLPSVWRSSAAKVCFIASYFASVAEAQLTMTLSPASVRLGRLSTVASACTICGAVQVSFVAS